MDYIHSYFKKYKNYSENDSNIGTHIYVYIVPETKRCLPFFNWFSITVENIFYQTWAIKNREGRQYRVTILIWLFPRQSRQDIIQYQIQNKEMALVIFRCHNLFKFPSTQWVIFLKDTQTHLQKWPGQCFWDLISILMLNLAFQH